MRKLITLGFTAALLVAMMLVPGAAVARKHRSCPRSATADRNRDRLPDRWECRNRLSLRVNQARRDQDRDGLNNLGEFRAGDNPRDADTDNDGVKDGEEHAGKIASFDAQTGTLVINLDGGGTVSGTVNSSTELECKSAASSTARASRDSGEAEQGDRGDGDRSGGDNGGSGDNDQQGENENENENACTTADLQAGRTVREAELKVTSAGSVFEKIEVVV